MTGAIAPCAVVAAMLWAATPAQAAPPAPVPPPAVTPAQAAPPAPVPPVSTSTPPPLPSRPSPPSPEALEKQRRIDRATPLHDEARALYQEGEYRAAIAKLEAAVRLDADGKELIYNLAVIHEKLAEIDVAERYYSRYLEMIDQPKEREQVEAVLRRLQGAKRELRRPDPSKPSPSAAQRAALSSTRARLPVAGASRPIEPWVFVGGGIAAGALILGNVFAVLALTQDPGSGATTRRGVSVADLQADADAAHRYSVAAEIAVIVAGISSAATLSLYLATPPRAPPAVVSPPRGSGIKDLRAGALSPGTPRSLQSEPPVSVALGSGGAQLRVRF